MSASTRTTATASEGTEVVKWYTRARRFPQLIGKTPDGATIWGGPYTYTQVIAGVGFIVLGSKTTGLWGHFGLIGNALILLGCAYGLVLLLGRLPIGSRNPISVATGVVRALSCPPHGQLGGTPVRLPRPRPARSRLVVTPGAPTLADLPQAPQPTPTPTATPAAMSPARARRPRWSPPAASARLPTAPPTSSPPPITTPGPGDRRAAPALTGVQRLLASAGAAQED